MEAWLCKDNMVHELQYSEPQIRNLWQRMSKKSSKQWLKTFTSLTEKERAVIDEAIYSASPNTRKLLGIQVQTATSAKAFRFLLRLFSLGLLDSDHTENRALLIIIGNTSLMPPMQSLDQLSVASRLKQLEGRERARETSKERGEVRVRSSSTAHDTLERVKQQPPSGSELLTNFDERMTAQDFLGSPTNTNAANVTTPSSTSVRNISQSKADTLAIEHNPYNKGEDPESMKAPGAVFDTSGLAEELYSGFIIEKAMPSPGGGKPSWAFQAYRQKYFESDTFRAEANERAKKAGSEMKQYYSVPSKYRTHVDRLLRDLNSAESTRGLEWVIVSVEGIHGSNKQPEFEEVHVIVKRIGRLPTNLLHYGQQGNHIGPTATHQKFVKLSEPHSSNNHGAQFQHPNAHAPPAPFQASYTQPRPGPSVNHQYVVGREQPQGGISGQRRPPPPPPPPPQYPRQADGQLNVPYQQRAGPVPLNTTQVPNPRIHFQSHDEKFPVSSLPTHPQSRPSAGSKTSTSVSPRDHIRRQMEKARQGKVKTRINIDYSTSEEEFSDNATVPTEAVSDSELSEEDPDDEQIRKLFAKWTPAGVVGKNSNKKLERDASVSNTGRSNGRSGSREASTRYAGVSKNNL